MGCFLLGKRPKFYSLLNLFITSLSRIVLNLSCVCILLVFKLPASAGGAPSSKAWCCGSRLQCAFQIKEILDLCFILQYL